MNDDQAATPALHPLLLRQLRKAGLTRPLADEVERLVGLVDGAYREQDLERRRNIRAIIAMGHALDRRIVAEGVETAAQFKLLKELAVDEVQGYFVGRPMAADALTPLLPRSA